MFALFASAHTHTHTNTHLFLGIQPIVNITVGPFAWFWKLKRVQLPTNLGRYTRVYMFMYAGLCKCTYVCMNACIYECALTHYTASLACAHALRKTRTPWHTHLCRKKGVSAGWLPFPNFACLLVHLPMECSHLSQSSRPYVFMYTHICVHTYNISTYTYVYRYTYIYLSIYIHVHIHIHIHIHTYIYISG